MFRHINWIREVAGMRGVLQVVREKLGADPGLVAVRRDELAHPVSLRVRSTDVATFQQIFAQREYAFDVRRQPRTIIDAGANVGFASVFFANRYPNARIIALEPERSNFELLVLNAAPYPNIVTVHGALWDDDTQVNLLDTGAGNWGFMTQEPGQDSSEHHGTIMGVVPTFTVSTLMKKYGLDHVDILKIDIEGAEREVFAAAGAWISSVDSLIAELHERRKIGCNRSFYNATNAFDEEWLQGENVYVTRTDGCIVRPRSAG